MVDELPRVGRQCDDVTNADCQLSQGPGIGKAHGADRHRALGAMHGGFRSDADADVAFHKPADGVEAAKLHAQTQRPADAVRLVRKKALYRARTIKADHVVIKNFGEADP